MTDCSCGDCRGTHNGCPRTFSSTGIQRRVDTRRDKRVLIAVVAVAAHYR